MKLGVVAYPIQDNIKNMPLNQFIDLLKPFSTQISVITGINNFESSDDNIETYFISHKNSNTIFKTIYVYICIQLNILIKIFFIYKHAEIWIFYCRGDMPLPMIITKILKRKNVIVLASSPIEGFQTNKKKSILSYFNFFLSKMSYLFSDLVLIYSKNLINQWNLPNLNNKIKIARKHFLNFDLFKIQTEYSQRLNLVGYIGRLDEGKGIGNFLNTIPAIINDCDDVEFIIGGDGPFKSNIELFLEDNDLVDKVQLLGWIPNEKLSDILNELKLLVIPSYSESGPMIALEAMACGTPVLATKVGFIPDIIENARTGFLLDSNNPESLIKKIKMCLNYPNMDLIISKAFLEAKQFKYEDNSQNLKLILESIK